MTRPGGPKEPLGLSVGARIVQEHHEEWKDRDVGVDDGPTYEEVDADLAQRIDAALAEIARERDEVRQAFARLSIGCDAVRERFRQERAAGEKALAEREAQCAALHGLLRVGVEFVKNGAPNEHFMEWARNADRVCASISDAARAFVERIQAPLLARIAELEKESCLNLANSDETRGRRGGPAGGTR